MAGKKGEHERQSITEFMVVEIGLFLCGISVKASERRPKWLLGILGANCRRHSVSCLKITGELGKYSRAKNL